MKAGILGSTARPSVSPTQNSTGRRIKQSLRESTAPPWLFPGIFPFLLHFSIFLRCPCEADALYRCFVSNEVPDGHSFSQIYHAPSKQYSSSILSKEVDTSPFIGGISEFFHFCFIFTIYLYYVQPQQLSEL